MLVKTLDAKEVQNSKNCIIHEYELLSENLSYATALINGRYPLKNRVVNTKCEQIYFAMSGSGIIHSEKGDFTINPGDLYLFTVGEKYWIEGESLLVAMANSPKWTPEQYDNVD